jgi:hypothetical protein
MVEIVLGRFLVDFAKLLAAEVHSWTESKKSEADATAAYISDIADQLDNYVLGLIDLADPTATEQAWAVRRDRYELDQTLENLGYTLKGRVDDQVLNQMIVSLTHGKVPGGMLIPALGHPKQEAMRLAGTARSAAIEGLVKAAAEFRAIAQSVAVRKGLPSRQKKPNRGRYFPVRTQQLGQKAESRIACESLDFWHGLRRGRTGVTHKLSTLMPPPCCWVMMS